VISDSGKYYLYRHIRLDKNEVFYIGIGGKTKNDYKYYKRAHKKHGRNSFWKNITNKTNYEVEIMLESDNLEFILQKEVEFIKLYGRRDLKKGTLVNLNDGGKTPTRYLVSNNTIEKLKKANLGKKYSDETKAKVSISSKRMWEERLNNGISGREFLKNAIEKRKVSISQYDKDMNFIKSWNSISDAMRSVGVNSTSNIVNVCKNKRITAHGYIWKYN